MRNGSTVLKSDQIVPLLLCQSCRENSLTVGDAGLVCGDCGASTPVHGNRLDFEAAHPSLSEEWRAQQAVALPEYNSDEYNVDITLPQLFGAFMAVSLDRHAKVLDVGCGITKQVPPYVAQLNLQNYLGLEPYRVSVLPNFPMLSGAIAECMPIRAQVLDAVIFATSMDHIVGIDEAMEETKRVLKPGGRIYMWIGLFDPDTIAKVKTFDVIWRGGPVKKALRFAAAQIEYAHTLWKMRDRAKKLASGVRLDPFHCRYYTRERIASDLQRWGLAERRALVVPGTNSMFVEAQRA